MQVWDVGRSQRRVVMIWIPINFFFLKKKKSDTKVCPRPTGFHRKRIWRTVAYEEKQMTAPTKIGAGASSAELTTAWCSTDWTAIEKRVKRLQMRIAKATREGRYGKVKALQWLMTHSYDAKILAVKRVVENRGGKTPGVDNSPLENSRAEDESSPFSSKKRLSSTTAPADLYSQERWASATTEHSHPEMSSDASFAFALL